MLWIKVFTIDYSCVLVKGALSYFYHLLKYIYISLPRRHYATKMNYHEDERVRNHANMAMAMAMEAWSVKVKLHSIVSTI